MDKKESLLKQRDEAKKSRPAPPQSPGAAGRCGG